MWLMLAKCLRLNERITSVDTPFGGDTDKALLDVIPDEKGLGVLKVTCKPMI